jgi:O-antigen ligase
MQTGAAQVMTPPINRRNVGVGARSALGKRVLASVMKGASTTNPFKEVDWTPAYLFFCLYTFSTISQRIPIGTATMVISLLTLPMEKRPIKLPAPALITFLLVGWSFFGILASSWPEVVIDYVNEFAKVCLVVFVALNVLTSRARLRAFMVGAIITWGLFPIRGTMVAYFVMHGTMNGRATWNYIYSNPNDLAALAIMALSVSLGILMVEYRRWVRMGAMLASGLLALIIVLTQSRGGLIALSVFALIYGRKYLTDVRRVVMVGLFSVVIIAVAPKSVWKRMATISHATDNEEEALDYDVNDVETIADNSSSIQRLAIWEVAATVIVENAVSGVGLGAYPDAHFVRWRRGGFSPLARGKRDTHSTYLNTMAELGIPGFLLWIGLIAHVMRVSRRARRKQEKRFPALVMMQFALEVGMYGTLVAAVWGSYFKLIPLYMHIVTIYAAARLLEAETDQPPRLMRRGAAPAGMQPFRGARRVGVAT